MKLFRLDRYEVAAAIFAVTIVGPIAWWAMDKAPALEIVRVESPAAPVDQLGALRLRYTAVYKRGDCSGEGQRKFVDVSGRATWTEPYEFRTGLGYDGRPVQLGKPVDLPPVSITVPRMAPGAATYENLTRFYCNPLQKLLGRQWPAFSIAMRLPQIDFTVADRVAAHPEPSTHIFQPDPDEVRP